MHGTVGQAGRTRWQATMCRVLIVLAGMAALVVFTAGGMEPARTISEAHRDPAFHQAVDDGHAQQSNHDDLDIGCGYHLGCQALAILSDVIDMTPQSSAAASSPHDQDRAGRWVIPKHKPPIPNTTA